MTIAARSNPISQLDLQAFSVARAMLILAARELRESMEESSLSLADRERVLRMCDLAHRMGRRALGIGKHQSRR